MLLGVQVVKKMIVLNVILAIQRIKHFAKKTLDVMKIVKVVLVQLEMNALAVLLEKY